MLFAQIIAPPTFAQSRPADVRAQGNVREQASDLSLDPRNYKVDPQDARIDPRYMRRDAREVRELRDLPGPMFSGGAVPTPYTTSTGSSEVGVRRPSFTYSLQAAVIEGYNSNVIETQAKLRGPLTKHPSPFTGFEALASFHKWFNQEDEQLIQIQVRGQHYTPLDSYKQPDDGTIIASWGGHFALDRVTTLTGYAVATVGTINSARMSDGPVFQIEPADVQRTYSISTARLALVRDVTTRWRLQLASSLLASTTIRDTPLILPTGAYLAHRGLDYLQPGVELRALYDITDKDHGNLRVEYAPTYSAYLVDLSKSPPQYLGSATQHQGEVEVNYIHSFTEYIRTQSSAGAAIASAPVLDTDRRPIISPILSQKLISQTPYWVSTTAASFGYGSANPRLGFGPSLSAETAIVGSPFPHSPTFRNLSVLFNGVATRAAFRAGSVSLSRLTFVSVGGELRYAIGNWWGIVAGYSYRSSVFQGADSIPALQRHIVFLGITGFWSSDRFIPQLTTFSLPLTSG